MSKPTQMNHEDVQAAEPPREWQRTISRMPFTMRPALNRELSEWGVLFPFERKMVGSFFDGADSLSAVELQTLTANLRSIETKMNIDRSSFNENAETLENSSQLARSAYYSAWRTQVQSVFRAIEAHAPAYSQPGPQPRRVVLLLLPQDLPVAPQTFSDIWKPVGSAVHIIGGAENLCDCLMSGRQDPSGNGSLFSGQSDNHPSSYWFIDAGHCQASAPSTATINAISSLSFTELKPFKDRFLAELNTIPRDMSEADKTITVLRQTDWTQWCPVAWKGQRRLQRFVVDLFLTGNGSLIFPNSFVEWGASEAFRRARPQVVVARFGMRYKPKPFSSIAIFEDQDKVSTLPDQDDPTGSAADAVILAKYVWLAAQRFSEYKEALCLCVSEHLNQGWLVLPQGTERRDLPGQLSAEELVHLVTTWRQRQ